MRTLRITLGVTFLIAGLLVATEAWAKKITAAGSVTLVQCAGIDASGNCLSPSIPAGLVVTAVTGKRPEGQHHATTPAARPSLRARVLRGRGQE